MTSLTTAAMNSPYQPYYGQATDFYNNQLGLPGLTHLQTELEKKKRDSPGAYQVSSPGSSIPTTFAGLGQIISECHLSNIIQYHSANSGHS